MTYIQVSTIGEIDPGPKKNVVTLDSLASFDVECEFEVDAHFTSIKVRCAWTCRDGSSGHADMPVAANDESVTVTCNTSCSGLLYLSAHLLDESNQPLCDPDGAFTVRESQMSCTPMFEVEFRSGSKLRFPEGANAKAVRDVVEILEKRGDN